MSVSFPTSLFPLLSLSLCNIPPPFQFISRCPPLGPHSFFLGFLSTYSSLSSSNFSPLFSQNVIFFCIRVYLLSNSHSFLSLSSITARLARSGPLSPPHSRLLNSLSPPQVPICPLPLPPASPVPLQDRHSEAVMVWAWNGRYGNMVQPVLLSWSLNSHLKKVPPNLHVALILGFSPSTTVPH